MNRIVGVSIVAIVALVIAFVFARYFEQVTERVYVGFKGEAARNHHLAAERFLQRAGHKVNHLRGQAQFEQVRSNAVLLWSRAPSDGERKRLLEWVKGGGHLIVDTPQNQEALLKEIGVEHYWPGADEEEEEAEQTQPDAAAAQAQANAEAQADNPQRPDAESAADETGKPRTCPPGRFTCPEPVLVSAGKEEFSLEMELEARLRATNARAPLRSAQDDAGDVLLEYPLGRGRMTVLANDRHFLNDRIGEHDHAAWLRYVIAVPNGAAKPEVWFANVPLSASLSQWLRQHAWPALLAAAIAIALGLWRAVTRFGPLLPGEAPGRLSFRDHLVACGRFHWRHAAADHLLQSVEHEAQRGDAGATAAAGQKAAPRHYGGRALEAPAFVQSVRGLQRRLLAARRSRDR
jgi:hypothetical protein